MVLPPAVRAGHTIAHEPMQLLAPAGSTLRMYSVRPDEVTRIFPYPFTDFVSSVAEDALATVVTLVPPTGPELAHEASTPAHSARVARRIAGAIGRRSPRSIRAALVSGGAGTPLGRRSPPGRH